MVASSIDVRERRQCCDVCTVAVIRLHASWQSRSMACTTQLTSHAGERTRRQDSGDSSKFGVSCFRAEDPEDTITLTGILEAICGDFSRCFVKTGPSESIVDASLESSESMQCKFTVQQVTLVERGYVGRTGLMLR